MIVFAKIIIVVKQLFFLAADLIRVSPSLLTSVCSPVWTVMISVRYFRHVCCGLP